VKQSHKNEGKALDGRAYCRDKVIKLNRQTLCAKLTIFQRTEKYSRLFFNIINDPHLGTHPLEKIYAAAIS